MKNAFKKNNEIAVEELISCCPTPQVSNKGEEKKDKTNTNFKNGMKKARVDGEEKTSHQQIQPSTKKTCPTSVKKRTSGYTECNRNKEQKGYNNCDENYYKVGEIM